MKNTYKSPKMEIVNFSAPDVVQADPVVTNSAFSFKNTDKNSVTYERLHY